MKKILPTWLVYLMFQILPTAKEELEGLIDPKYFDKAM
jgi:hypothetical protein